MKCKRFIALFILVAVIISMPLISTAELANPTTLGAPEHLGVSWYYGDACIITFSAPDDLREYVEARTKEHPEHGESLLVHFQIDYRIDNGSWHYTKEWDAGEFIRNSKNQVYFICMNEKNYVCSERVSLTQIFPEYNDMADFHDNGEKYLENHSVTFRVRFAETFDYGNTYVFSDWSNEYTLSSKMMGDPDKMINHAPVLKSVKVLAAPGGEPYFDLRTGRLPDEIQALNSISGGTVMTEIWMKKKGDADFQYIFYEWASWESINVDARDYFDKGKQSYDEESYEMKVRYALELGNYKQSGRSEKIYGPFSNVISHNMPAWSNTSQWATGEVQKAVNNGLYPDKLRGADLTRPITRAEFAAVALKLYEALSGKTAAPAPANTFTDTTDIEILKAYALDIVAGVGNNKFAPDEYVNREQAAAMLTRVYKKLKWDGWTLATDGTYSKHSLDNKGVAPFADDEQISGWAKPSVYFMAKYEIIKGLGGNKFAPKNTTSAEAASGYANATREQALAISNRTFEKVDTIQDGGPVSATPAQTQTTDSSIVGSWVLGELSGGTFNGVSGKYEGGATGLGQIYTFKPDGTYTALVVWSNTMFFTGKYTVVGDKLALTDRFVEESNDGGKTWGAKEALPDLPASYFSVGTDDSGKYLLLGEEGATLPLVDKKNAMKYTYKKVN